MKAKIIGGTITLAILAILVIRLVMASSIQDKQTAVAPVAVEVEKVLRSALLERVRGVGTVLAVKDVKVSSETAGRVMKVAVEVGDYVEQGQLLAQIDDELKIAAVDQARAQAIASESFAKKALRDAERADSLYVTKDVSDAEREAYRSAARSAEAQRQSAIAGYKVAERQLEDTRIKSPISGYVASKHIERGELVDHGKEVANIVDLSSVKIRLSTPEEDISKLRLGQRAAITVDAHPGDTLTGEVYSIGSKAESPTGHTYPVDVLLRNRGVLKSGMFARVEIEAGGAGDALTVSKQALLNEDTNPLVYVADGRLAKATPVKLGIKSGNRVQILAGLSQSALVVSFGQNKLKDGSPILYHE